MKYKKGLFSDILEFKNSLFCFYSQFSRYLDEYDCTEEEKEDNDFDLIEIEFKKLSIHCYFTPVKYWKNYWHLHIYTCDTWEHIIYSFQSPWVTMYLFYKL